MTGGAAPVLFDGVRVFDGTRVWDRISVLVRDGVVYAVGEDLDDLPGTTRISGSGLTLLPGLIDAHTHVFPGQLEQALMFGVTTELVSSRDRGSLRPLSGSAEARW